MIPDLIPGKLFLRAVQRWGADHNPKDSRYERRTIGGQVSKVQFRRWENPRKKAIANFVEVIGDMDISEITTYDLFEFRNWWVDKMVCEGVTPNSANKDFAYVASTLRDVARAHSIELRFDTKGLALDEVKRATRPAFLRDWIPDKILAPGALDNLSPEARAILIGMISTGYRPSEAAGLKPEHIRLDANIPHIVIKPEGRQLKKHNSERVIPSWASRSRRSGPSRTGFRDMPTARAWQTS